MGKVRINTLGDENLEEKQKIKAEKRHEAKKAAVAVGTEKSTEAQKKTVVTENVEKPADTEENGESRKHRDASVSSVRSSVSSVNARNVRSKKYQAVAVRVDKNKTYPLSEALDILPQIHLAKFDETVELHINTYSTGVSGSVSLPHGTGKQVKVAILAPSKDASGADALLQEIEAGVFNFDILIATPDAMPRLAKVARILGPRGLMPNPKNGTVTAKPEEVAKQYQGGQVNFKTEAKTPVIHLSVGKLSFQKDQLHANISTVLQTVQSKNIRNVTLKSTMSPGIKLALSL